MEDKINKSIVEAMKARDEVRRDTLRNVKKLVIEAKTAEKHIDKLPDTAVVKIIQKLAKQGEDSAKIYKEQGREDLYEYESAQVKVLREFLPKQLDDSELLVELKEVIKETGATSMQDIGKVMGEATKRLAGRVDGGRISQKVRELLS